MTSKLDITNIARKDYNADLVTINHDVIEGLDRRQIEGDGGSNLTEGTGNMALEESIRYAIGLNSINYRFWDLKDGQFMRYQHAGKVGALAMTTSFEQAWQDNIQPLATLNVALVEADIVRIFGDMPDAASRVVILNEVLLSPKLVEIAQTIAHDLRQAEGTFVLGTEYAQMLADAFPTAYSDPLLKKAQLAISAVWLACAARGHDIVTDLTAFADYQIPRILRALGVLSYSPDLANKIDTMTVLDEYGAEERALRAASILAIEELSRVHNVSSAAIDHFLWTRRNEAKEPFHLCFTTKY